jgi:hypothetical protein
MVFALRPGGQAFVLTDEGGSIEGRCAGLELRDTVLILSPGPCTRFAFLFRAPFPEGALIDRVATAGIGALNINKCRVGYHGEGDRLSALPGSMPGANRSIGTFQTRDRSAESPRDNQSAEGRWPPNIVLIHGPGCRREGTKKIPGITGGARRTGALGGMNDDGWKAKEVIVHKFHDGAQLETVPAWFCEPLCPARLLDEQTGERPSTLTGRADPTKVHGNPGDNHGTSLFGAGNSHVYADSGGASRFYPQFTDEAELLSWLRRLLDTPA